MADTAGRASPILKQELLIKLLRMTASPNDGEALVALRKANTLLATAGWDWDKLINGKITVVADPFNNLADPFATRPASAPPPPPARPAAYRAPPQPSAASILFKATPAQPISHHSRVNKFVGFCYCCGVEVVTNAGRIFVPANYNPAASAKIHVICIPCTTSGTIYSHPTGQRIRKRGRVNISDLI